MWIWETPIRRFKKYAADIGRHERESVGKEEGRWRNYPQTHSRRRKCNHFLIYHASSVCWAYLQQTDYVVRSPPASPGQVEQWVWDMLNYTWWNLGEGNLVLQTKWLQHRCVKQVYLMHTVQQITLMFIIRHSRLLGLLISTTFRARWIQAARQQHVSAQANKHKQHALLFEATESFLSRRLRTFVRAHIPALARQCFNQLMQRSEVMKQRRSGLVHLRLRVHWIPQS